MELLLIFDENVVVKEIQQQIHDAVTQINLFPLTSNYVVIEEVTKKIKQLGHVNVTILDSARLIHEEVVKLQDTIHEWSSSLSEYNVYGKQLKEWFVLPDGNVSSWWFSIISEKNTTQDTVFFKIAQLNAVAKHVSNSNYSLTMTALSDKKQRQIFKKLIIAKKQKIKNITIIKSTSTKSLKIKLLESFNQLGMLGALLTAGVHWVLWLYNGKLARRILPAIGTRLPAENPFVFTTYFPHVNEENVKQGVFRNKYGLPLQDKLNELNIPITWLLMPVVYNGYNFKSAMFLAKKFAENGEKLIVLHEYFTLKVFIKSFFWWIRKAVLSVFLWMSLDKKKITGKLTCQEGLPLVKYLWSNSFIGFSAVRGIIFYLTYQDIFRSVKKINKCLFYCEMQAWEKALIAAKNKISPHIKTISFQHTSVMRNYFFYFYKKNETVQNGKAIDFPLPDLLLANGNLMYSLLSESGYSNLAQCEAIRQLYLNELIAKPIVKRTDRPILLIAGSFDRNETKSLISMVYMAFPETIDFEIWFKGFPSTPIENIFKELNIDINASGYKIFHSDISTLLQEATIAIVPSSAVAIEAFALQCKVIVPIFSDTMLMNPLIDFDTEYYLAGSVQELKIIVKNCFKTVVGADIAKIQHFINEYWNLNPELPNWTTILTT